VYDKEDGQVLKFPYYEDTRSINFEDMLDSENNPIFASLSERGKGGSICTRGNNECSKVCCYKFAQIWFVTFGKKSYENSSTLWSQYAYNINDFFGSFNKIKRKRDYIGDYIKVIGIQK